ncbi:MAG: hypothetical protein M3301_07510, partial [Chloroflexota bacterium]|nr:hypothetical protein [Chloroflexota bacterium]
MRRARKDHEATTNEQTPVEDRPWVASPAPERSPRGAGGTADERQPAARMMATPAARGAMAVPVAAAGSRGRSGVPRHAADVAEGPAHASATFRIVRRRRRRSMARIGADGRAVRPRHTFRIARPALAELAADRRGAPVLVLGVLLIASIAAGLPNRVGAADEGSG